MSGIIGKKIGMTRIFQEDGKAIPITVIQCQPNEVTQVKTLEKDGYSALVLGFDKLAKPKKTRKFSKIREFRVTADSAENYQKGQEIGVAELEDVELVEVTAKSKGKGFQGVIRRHNFHRGPETHGSHHHREPGSIGACAKPGRVVKGKKLPGRMGCDFVTLKKVKVISIDKSRNIVCLKGSLPGPNGGVVIIKKS